MKRIAGLALGAAALMAPVEAQAQTDYVICEYSVSVCVAARFELTGANGLTVYLFNGATAATKNMGSSLTQFGFNGLGGTNWTLQSAYFNDDGTPANTGTWAGWTQQAIPPGIPSLGIGGILVGANGPSGNGGVQTCDDAFGNGLNTCLTDGPPDWSAGSDWARFSFSYSGSTLADLTGLQWGFKVQAVEGNNGESFECGTTGEKLCSDDPLSPPTEIVPEPATMSLLAMGLAGMAAASRRRRKKK